MEDVNEAKDEAPLRGPWPAWALAGAILVSYPIQSLWLGSADAAADRFGLEPAMLWQGRWGGLITCMFIHGGWAHVGMNAAGALAFGAPVARLLETRRAGPLSFLAFFLVCGLAAGLAYAVLNPHGMAPVVGASGAVSGLFGAASRLMQPGPAPPPADSAPAPASLSPFLSRFVLGSAAAWVIVNVALGLAGFAPGMGAVQIAWQAHVAGYFAGLFLIGPWIRLFPPRQAPIGP